MTADYDVACVGGGFYGLALALFLRSVAERVAVIEREAEIMAHASAWNQARIHGGYHYPRSFQTAMSSRANLALFRAAFPEAVSDNFTAVYAIARHGSRITPQRFEVMFRGLGAPVERAPAQIRALFDPGMIAEVFCCEEPTFNFMRLRERMKARLAAAGVEIRLETEALRLVRAPEGGSVRVELAGGESLAAKRVFNVGYARLNDLLRASGLDPAPLKYELAEIALVRPPPQLEGLGVTVMDGPFFSILPFPAMEGLSSLTHVRYTPHYAWTDETSPLPAGATAQALPRESRWRHMAVDGRRYLPCLDAARWAESRFETKAILLRNEFDDGRPILLRQHAAAPEIVSVLGGKIDNVFDLFQALAGLESCWRGADARFL